MPRRWMKGAGLVALLAVLLGCLVPEAHAEPQPVRLQFVGIAAGSITTFAFLGTKFMHDRPYAAALAFLRALVRGARDAQGPYLKDEAIAASIARQTDLKLEAVERSTPYAVDPDLDIMRFEPGLRDQERVHREDGRLSYQGELSFDAVIDPSLVRKAAASIK